MKKPGDYRPAKAKPNRYKGVKFKICNNCGFRNSVDNKYCYSCQQYILTGTGS